MTTFWAGAILQIMQRPTNSKALLSGLGFLALLVGICCGAAPTPSAGKQQQTQDKTCSLTHGGLERTYRLHVPVGRDKDRPVPLVIVLHGGGGTGDRTVKLTRGGFDRLADKDGFLVVYPDGVENHWNDGRTEVSYRAHKEKIDDVGFLSALIGTLVREYNVDAGRVYVTGISNGAMMSLRMGWEASDKVAAIAPVAGTMPEVSCEKCAPQRPVPVLLISGTEDPLVPWGGGDVHFGRRTLGKVLSADRTIEFWMKHDGCAEKAEVTRLPDADPADGTQVRCETHGGGEEGSEVVLYAIEHGGHTWPGGEQYLRERFIGKTCRDIDACEVIWEFFKKHERKPAADGVQPAGKGEDVRR